MMSVSILANSSYLVPEIIYELGFRQHLGDCQSFVLLCNLVNLQMLTKREYAVLYCRAVVGCCTIFPPFKRVMANFADPDNSMYLSSSKNAFLVNALVSLEGDLLEHGRYRQRDRPREKKKEMFEFQRLKGRDSPC